MMPLRSSILSPGQAASSDPLSWLDDLAELQYESASSHSAGVSSSLSFSSPAESSNAGSSIRLSDQGSPNHSQSANGGGYASSSSEDSDSSSSRPGKKSKIALDPRQPLTAKGNPRARVYVACKECRNRKIRCDGAKPVCFNCHRRDSEIQVCDYDPAPRRRGQDKIPGSRLRSNVGQKTAQHGKHPPSTANDSASMRNPPAVGACQLDFEDIIHGFDPSDFDADAVSSFELPNPPPLEDDEEEEQTQFSGHLIQGPSMQFTRETWWDGLITLYASQAAGNDVGSVILNAEQRAATIQSIYTDIRATVRTSIYWLSFFHLPRFFASLFDSSKRATVQPSLILSILAIGVHTQSSELKEGAKGRAWALKLADHAHSAFQGSLNSNWVDMGLIHAAWFMAYFELQGHPAHSWQRGNSSLLLLDSLVRLFSLTTLDSDVPDAKYSIFEAQKALLVYPERDPAFHVAEGGLCPLLVKQPPETPCACDRFTLKAQWPTVVQVAPYLGGTTLWPDELSEGEIRKEEARRLVWSSVMLTAGRNSFVSVQIDYDPEALYLKDYHNYSLFFPGEVVCHGGQKTLWRNNIWNLCLRAMILWHTSVRYRTEPKSDLQERSAFATSVWLEADAIEAALNKHTCGLEANMLYQAREYLFISRMCVSHEFQRFAPEILSNGMMAFYRSKAEAWLRSQMEVTVWVWKHLLENPESDKFSCRPLLIYWFMGHVTRALILYDADQTLSVALDAAKASVKPMEYFMRLWPCESQKLMWEPLRMRLVRYCLEAGVSPPEHSLPLSEIELATKLAANTDATGRRLPVL